MCRAEADWGHGEPSLAARRVGGSADVDRSLLDRELGGSLWLSGQLKNRGLLTLTKERQQQDPPGGNSSAS